MGWELLSAASKALANTLAGTEVFVKVISVPHVLPRGCGSGDFGPAYHYLLCSSAGRCVAKLLVFRAVSSNLFFFLVLLHQTQSSHSSGLTSKLTWVFCGRTLWLLVWWLVKQRDAS